MILSAGLTPAWQQILVLDRLRTGEVNRARQAVWCSSGKVFNVGLAVHHLGGPGITLAPVGGSPLAEIEEEFAALGMCWRWVVTEAATRVCTTLLDRASGTVTELVEEGRPLAQRELDEFGVAYAEEAARADVVVLAGSQPAGTPHTLYRDLLEKTPCRAVLDFRGASLLASLERKPFVVKPNREELAQTIGHPLNDDAQLREAMRELNRRGAEWVVVTQGAGPVWLASLEKTYCLRAPPAFEMVNPIGCGDALAGTIAWATASGHDIVDAVRLGIAAAGENLRQLLPCRLEAEKVRQAAQKVQVEEL